MPILKSVARYWRARSGNIAITAALTAPVMIAGLAISVDYGALTLQRRAQQATADLAAIAAAASPARAEEALRHYFSDNDLPYGVHSGNFVILPDGRKVAPEAAAELVACTAAAKPGTYRPDRTLKVSERFTPTATNFDAVQVTLTCPGQLYFASMFAKVPEITVAGTATANKTASFWIGSRLASLQDGVLNAILGGLLGAEISLKAVDYRSLLSANVELLSFLRALRTELNLTAVTYDDVLNTEVKLGPIFAAIRKTGGLSVATDPILRALQDAVVRSTRTLKLREVLNLDDVGRLPLDGPGGTAPIGLMELISAVAIVSGGSNQIGLDLGANVPGLAKVSVNLAIGEPPVATPSIAVGRPGSRVRTAQVRLKADVEVAGVLSLLGTRIHLPLYVEVANAEAELSAIRCMGPSSTNAVVDLKVVPGVAEVAIGKVDANAFINFGTRPRVNPADLVTTPLLKISARAQVEVNDVEKRTLTFTGQEISYRTSKTVSTRTPLTSAVSTLLGRLDLNIDLLGLGIGLPASNYRAALISTLSGVTEPLDGLVYNLLLVLGVRIGEADVGVTGVRCTTPVLVL
jgi:Predicted membrane protein